MLKNIFFMNKSYLKIKLIKFYVYNNKKNN